MYTYKRPCYMYVTERKKKKTEVKGDCNQKSDFFAFWKYRRSFNWSMHVPWFIHLIFVLCTIIEKTCTVFILATDDYVTWESTTSAFKQSTSNDNGAIIGGCVGAVLVVILILSSLFVYRRSKRKGTEKG